MKISTRARYGTRAMIELAMNYQNGPVLLKDISRRQDISFRYLNQLITHLKTAGLVKNIRGKGGGYVLGKPPSLISLREIVHILDGSVAPVDCVDDPEICPRTESCATRDVWVLLKDSIVNILESQTLEEMAKRQEEKGNIPY